MGIHCQYSLTVINAATYDQELLEDTSETISDEYPSKFQNFKFGRVPMPNNIVRTYDVEYDMI